MKKQIDHFLLGLLWLLASVLGASFWFNTKFGFDIFSMRHWQYFGQLQASKTAVRSSFYISMIVIVIVVIVCLYLIVRPKFRRINLKPAAPMLDQAKSVAQAARAPETEQESAPVALAGMTPARPPRLKLPAFHNRGAAPVIVAAPVPVHESALPSVSDAHGDFADINEVFQSANYLVKTPPRIGGLRPALFAVGADEVLWIGAVGIEPERLKDAVTKLDNIFTETLEDIKINIRAFIINPKVANPDDMLDIEQFDSVNALRYYMEDNKNRELPDSEKEDFDAYSEYIDTIADYFNKS